MNTYFTFAVSALAIVSSVYAEEVVKYSTEDCPKKVTEDAYLTLMPIGVSLNLTKCSNATEFDLMQSTTLPSDDQTRDMCNSEDCRKFVAELKALGPPDCVLRIPITDLHVNLFEMANKFEPTCNPKPGYAPGGVHPSRP